MGKFIMSYVQRCKERKVFVLENNRPHLDGLMYEIEIDETTYFDHVSQSEDLTTSPRGIAPREFIDSEEISFIWDEVVDENNNNLDREDFNSDKEFEEAIINDYIANLDISLANYKSLKLSDFEKVGHVYYLTYYFTSSWGVTGNKFKSGKHYRCNKYLSQEEVEDELFKQTENRFQEDCSRDTTFYETLEEAEEARLVSYALYWDVSYKVAESILRKAKIIKEYNNQIEAENREKQNKIREAENLLIKAYSNLIEPQNEHFKETVQRLSRALTDKVSKNVFYGTVKAIRQKWKDNL